MTIGEVCLLTNDVSRLAAFYKQLLGMEKVLLNINEKNVVSIHVCEKLGGKLWDTIERYNEAEGHHIVRRYWIML